MYEPTVASATDLTRNRDAANGLSCTTNAPRPACPVCGGRLVEVRAKLQCGDCHRIVETCCEGGPG